VSFGVEVSLIDVKWTTHSTFKLPIQIINDSICIINETSKWIVLFQECSLIIQDEVPMQH
jgi:hypothetical protein